MDGIKNRYINLILIYGPNINSPLLNILINDNDLHLTKIDDNLYSLDCYIFNVDDIIKIIINNLHVINIIIDDRDIYCNYINDQINNQKYNPKDTENTFSIIRINYHHYREIAVTLFLEKKYYKTWLVKYINILDNDILYIIKYMLFNMLK